MKNYMCFHILASAVNIGKLQITAKFKSLTTGKNFKRGRKPKATPDLQRERPIKKQKIND